VFIQVVRRACTPVVHSRQVGVQDLPQRRTRSVESPYAVGRSTSRKPRVKRSTARNRSTKVFAAPLREARWARHRGAPALWRAQHIGTQRGSARRAPKEWQPVTSQPAPPRWGRRWHDRANPHEREFQSKLFNGRQRHAKSLRPTIGFMLIAFSVAPSASESTGSVSEAVAAAVRIVRDSGLPTTPTRFHYG